MIHAPILPLYPPPSSMFCVTSAAGFDTKICFNELPRSHQNYRKDAGAPPRNVPVEGSTV
jgi:hypothetical protein